MLVAGISRKCVMYVFGGDEDEDDDDEGGEEVIYEGTKFESATTDGSS